MEKDQVASRNVKGYLNRDKLYYFLKMTYFSGSKKRSNFFVVEKHIWYMLLSSNYMSKLICLAFTLISIS